MPNPYVAVHDTLRRRRRGHGAWLLPMLGAAAAAPLARPVLMGFLDGGSIEHGVEAVAFRLGAVVASGMVLSTYTDLVRGPDRAVLDPHPVLPRPLLAALARRAVRERAWLPAAAAVLLAPIALDGHFVAWAGAALVVLGAWLGGTGVGLAVHLGGVWAATSPGLARVLDAIRGDNPRTQAALIYAPGAAMAIVGAAVALASMGLSAALSGWAAGWSFLLLPPILGAIGLAAAGPLADRHYVRATAVLTEIDGMYAGVESAAESRRVYLDWLALGHRELLRALRQGWRVLRPWPLGAWMLGLLGALAGWSDLPEAPARTAALAGAAVLLFGALPARLAQGDPEWLDRALGVPTRRVAAARATAAWLYAQGAVIPAVLALAVRQGTAALVPFVQVEAMALSGAVLGAALAARWRERAAWTYGPLGLVVWAAGSGIVG